jgi:hypothetical protein
MGETFGEALVGKKFLALEGIKQLVERGFIFGMRGEAPTQFDAAVLSPRQRL